MDVRRAQAYLISRETKKGWKKGLASREKEVGWNLVGPLSAMCDTPNAEP